MTAAPARRSIVALGEASLLLEPRRAASGTNDSPSPVRTGAAEGVDTVAVTIE